MASFNKVILMGNLTRDPKLSYLPSGTPVCEIGLAVNHVYYDKATSQKKEKVCFVDCNCFGRSAETLNQYMQKGRPLLVEGRLDLDMWEDPNGNKRSKHRIFIENFTFVGGGGQQGGGQQGGYQQQQQQQAPQQQQQQGDYQQQAPQQQPPQQPPQQQPPQQQPPNAYDAPAGGDDIPF